MHQGHFLLRTVMARANRYWIFDSTPPTQPSVKNGSVRQMRPKESV